MEKPLVTLFKKIQKFIVSDVWEKSRDELSARKERWFIKQLRVVLYTAQHTQSHGTVIRSAALTFFSLMSLVPVLALAFGIIKGFGLQGTVEEYLFERFADNSDTIRILLTVVNNVLVRTSGGIVAFSGMAVLVWAAVRVFGNIEGAFNAIWEVKKPRSITRRASTYAAGIFVVPLVAVILVVGLSYARKLISNYASIPYSILYSIGSLLVLWLLFTLVYKVIPNTKVKFSAAAIAAAIAVVTFTVFQTFYVYLQNGVSSYNIIYGSFAAIPLFLFWMQTSWQIVLFGAELSFAFQNVDAFVQEHTVMGINYREKRKVMTGVMVVVTKNFLDGKGSISAEEVSQTLTLPLRLVRDILYTLEEAGLVVAVSTEKSQKTNYYIPARDVHELTLYGTIESVESAGTELKDLNLKPFMAEISRRIDAIDREAMDSTDNVTLKNILGR